jgi:hypothetical protein
MLPAGVPYVFWDFQVQIFQKNQITMIYRQSNECRYSASMD